MYVIDPEDLKVYELPNSAVTSIDTNVRRVAPISFPAFEHAAQTSYSTLVQVGAQGNRPCILPSSIMFVHFKEKENGETRYAWGSPITVGHHYREYPVLSERYLGEDFLLLWPYPLAIHVWLSFKERFKLDPVHFDDACQMVVDHPPSVLHRKGLADLAHDGLVAPADLTLAQRLFVASIRPNLPRFALRQPGDDWSERLNALHAEVSAPWRTQPTNAAALLRLCTYLRAPATRGTAPFDLPDEILCRILSLRLAEDLSEIETAVAAVEALSLVSRQFCACARDTVARMLARVEPLCAQLDGPHPLSPATVQIMLWASGLTLSKAFTPDIGKWHAYVGARRQLITHERRALCQGADPAKRHSLLWD